VNFPHEEPIPPTLAARPRDRRGLPIPPVNLHPDSTGANTVVDFTTINTVASTYLALEHRCSLCGEPFGRWIAFIGGPRAAELMRYTDPPACPDCAHAAMRLCPYITAARHRRAPSDRPGAGIMPPTANATKPAAWLVGITRRYTTHYLPGHGFTVYRPARFATIHTYHYGPDGRIDPDPTTRQG
jgi:hypothetical protein